jgi:hypothetical protein
MIHKNSPEGCLKGMCSQPTNEKYFSVNMGVLKGIVVSCSGREFLFDLPWRFRYTVGTTDSFEAKVSDQRIGKAVSPMCFSPCFVHATQNAFVQRQLLQCRTCGSQAFHVVDCCRNPDYVRVPTSPVCERLKAWLGGVQAKLRAWLLPPHPRPAEPVSPEALDAWEARPLVISNARDTRAPRETGVDKAVEVVEHETVSTHR